VTFEYEEQILRSLRRISRAIDVYSRKLASEYQLTVPQLVCLRFINRIEVTTPGALAREVSLSQATVTGILDRLERRGLVLRERATDDRRRVYIRMTSAGEQVVEAAPIPLQQRFSHRLSSLSQKDRARIDEVLSSIVEMMEAQQIEASPVLAAGLVTAEPADVAEFLDPSSREPERRD
jgi:DNA-binding MarR family transcriptional regulator